MLKYILLLSLFTVAHSGLINCQLEMQGAFIFQSCRNNTWTDKPEYIALLNKTVLADPFSANSVWLDKDNNVIGVSDKTDAIFNINGEDWPNEQRQALLIRILHSVPVPGGGPVNTEYVKPNPVFDKLANQLRDSKSVCRISQYVKRHPHDHENVVEWCMKQYMNPDVDLLNHETMGEVRERITDLLMHTDRSGPLLCNTEDKEDCQILLTCDCKEGDTSEKGDRCTYKFYAFKDLTKSNETPLHNCVNWEGFKTLQPDQKKLAMYRVENMLLGPRSAELLAHL